MSAVSDRDALSQGQTPAVGRHELDLVFVQLPKHAGHRIASTLIGSRKNSAANHFAQRPGGYFMELLVSETGNVGKVCRIFARHLKFKGLATDRASIGVGFDGEFLVGCLAKDGNESGRRQECLTRFLDLEAADFEPNA